MSDYASSFKKSSIVIIVLILLSWIGVFIGGRLTVEDKVVIKYVNTDSIAAKVAIDDWLVNETIPEAPELPLKNDTVWLDSIVYVVEKVDTAAIIADYIASREYAPVLFDSPQLGQLSLSAIIQYNRLQDLSYTYLPVYKEITRYRVPVFQPYIGGSLNTLNQMSFVGGIFYKKSGLELQYISDFERRKKGWGVGLRYKF